MNKFNLFIGLAFFSWTVNAQFTCAQADANPITTGITTVTEVVSGQVPFPECAENFGQLRFGGRWYKFTATIDGVGKVTSDLATNPTVDTRLHIYSGTCSTLTCEGGNDDKEASANNRFSEVIWPIYSGVSYYIAWDNQYSEDGFDFELTETAVSCPDATASWSNDFDDINRIVLCYETEDVDGNNSDWKLQELDVNGDNIKEDYVTTGTLSFSAKEDWLFSPKISLVNGGYYQFSFKYNGGNGTFPANENLEVLLLDSQSSSANVLSTLYTDNNIVQTGNFTQIESMANAQSIPYTSTTSGDYYLAFKATSPANTGSLLLFEYSIDQPILSANNSQINNLKHVYDAINAKVTITSSDIPLKNIEIYNIIGQLALSKELNTNQEILNVSVLAQGLYIVRVKDQAQGIKLFKLLKH